MSSSVPPAAFGPVVGIGASAGGVPPLLTVIAGLPADFPAPVLVTLHMVHGRADALPTLLARRSALRVVAVADGAVPEPGAVYVARPDHHLSLEGGRLRSTHGPRVNGYRPAVDRMLESMASERGADAIGVILSGTLDDGSRGAAAIKAAGGTVFVQDAEEAQFAGMVTNAQRRAEVDGTYTAELLPHALVRAARRT